MIGIDGFMFCLYVLASATYECKVTHGTKQSGHVKPGEIGRALFTYIFTQTLVNLCRILYSDVIRDAQMILK